jgi:hypothetical protein
MNLKIVGFGDVSFDQLWTEGIEESKKAHPFYSSIVRKFDHSLLGKNLISDDSFIFLDEARTVQALVPLYRCRVGDKCVYGLGNGYLVAPIVSARENTKIHQTVINECFLQIERQAKEYDVSCHKTYYNCTTVMSGTYFSNPLVSLGYSDESCPGMVLSLADDEDSLWSNVRKSYRPLVNKALRGSEVLVIDSCNFDFDVCEEYRKLHFMAAGRETRAKESFHAQYELIKNNQGFLVFVTSNGAFAGAYFFYDLSNCVFYASAATHPDCDAQSGIGHLGLWKGIQKAKERKARYFDFGMFIADPTDSKAKSIEFFKEGFGGSRVIVFRGTKIFQRDQYD